MKLDELLERAVANIIPGKKELLGRLQNGKILSVYLGIDPTSTKIHLGHAVTLRKLNEFAKNGHNVTFLIGDFTALIGDTSDKDSERPALSSEEIAENFKTYKKQAEKVLDFSKVKVKFNSAWLKKLNFEDIVKLTQNFSVGDFVGRELVKKRLESGKRVGLHEFLYPVMQGYDSFYMDTDLQIGGTDQTFNMQAGRALIKNLKNKESFVLTTQILEGNDGRKMSKSWGNAIWLDDSPTDMYAKVMAIKDELIIQYFTLATSISMEEIKVIENEIKKGDNPLPAKKQLAYQIVLELYGVDAANKAQANFQQIIQEKNIPIELYTPKNFLSTILDVITDLTSRTRSDTKRLIEQGGVSIDGEKIDLQQANKNIENGMTIKIKRRIIRIKPLS